MITSNNNPKIYLLSDTHLIADDLHDNGSAFERMQDTAAGKDLKYQSIMLNAFVRKIIKDKPTAVIITGDLTFNGAKMSAEQLAKIFTPLKKNGITFLVIPGNHDIYDGWARKFDGDAQYRVPQISPADWKNIFHTSYDEAVSQDSSSLAYSVELNSNYRLIMADSNRYGNEESTSYPITDGVIEPTQIKWIENELKIAQEKKQHILFFMHHNLYDHNSIVNGGFTLDNASELRKLFIKYNVKLTFSGHIHAQNIIGPKDNCPTIDIASSCFSMCDQGYGVINLSPDQVEYQRHSFDSRPYLTEEEMAKLPSGDFHDYLAQVFMTVNEKQSARFKQNIDCIDDWKKVVELVDKLNWNFFIGKNSYTKQEIMKIKNSLPYQILTTNVSDMKNYVDSLINIKQDSWHAMVKY